MANFIFPLHQRPVSSYHEGSGKFGVLKNRVCLQLLAPSI